MIFVIFCASGAKKTKEKSMKKHLVVVLGLAALLVTANIAHAADAPDGSVKAVEMICGNGRCGSGLTFSPEPAEMPLGGSVVGLYSIVAGCWNLSTGRHVLAPPGAGRWDCRKLGLQVKNGDRVVIGAVGRVGGIGILSPDEPVAGGATTGD